MNRGLIEKEFPKKELRRFAFIVLSLVICVFMLVYSITNVVRDVEPKQIVIDVGRELKDIYREIEKD